MNVSLDEHRLGGLRWIVLRGPDREAFRALGEHTRDEIAALTQTWPLLARLHEHVASPPGSDRLAAVRRASSRCFPEVWAELATFAAGAAVPFEDLMLLNVRGDIGQVAGGIGRIVSVEAAAGRFALMEVGSGSGPLLWHTNHGRYIPGSEPSPDGNSVARGEILGTLTIPAKDPDPAWFLRVLADTPLPEGVRADPAPGHPATTLCTFIADLTAGEAVIAARDDQPAAIPLRDLAEGNPHRQRQLAGTRE